MKPGGFERDRIGRETRPEHTTNGPGEEKWPDRARIYARAERDYNSWSPMTSWRPTGRTCARSLWKPQEAVIEAAIPQDQGDARRHPIERGDHWRRGHHLSSCCLMDLEGIVSKRTGSRYVSGRTRAWLKRKNPNFER